MEVQRVFADDAVPLRALRLRALRADPDDFGSTLAHEASLPDEHWQPEHFDSDSASICAIMRDVDRWEQMESERYRASGRHGRKGHRCPLCRGSGQVPGISKQRGTGMGSNFGACPECGGSGHIGGDHTLDIDDERPGTSLA
jgi:hypothetical protein